jgi:hypothetical protein
MTIYFSGTTRGFYDDSMVPKVPEDAIQISDELHKELLLKQADGMVITVDESGVVTAAPPPKPTHDVLMSRCKDQADRLLAATDWTMMPDVDLSNKSEFSKFRSAVRELRINPTVDPTWPKIPKPIWNTKKG